MLHTHFQTTQTLIMLKGHHTIVATFILELFESQWPHTSVKLAPMAIWVNQHLNSFLVGCLNPTYQGTDVHVGSPQPTHGPLHEVQLFRGYHVLGINRLLYMVLCYVGGL